MRLLRVRRWLSRWVLLGALTASGQTLIGGLESSAALADGLDDSDLVEGGVVANGTADHLPSGVPATLTLRDEVRVVGDAKTSGTFQKDDTVTIERGEVKQSPDKEDLPQISIAEYDPADKAVQHTDATVADGSPLYGFHRYANPGNPAYAVTFTEEVDLQGALIYVDGDVILDKPLKGTGALVATGSVTLAGWGEYEGGCFGGCVGGWGFDDFWCAECAFAVYGSALYRGELGAVEHSDGWGCDCGGDW